MHGDAAEKHAAHKEVTMNTKFDIIRRFANEAVQLTQLLSFNLEVEVDLTEDDLVRDIELRGYGVRAGH